MSKDDAAQIVLAGSKLEQARSQLALAQVQLVVELALALFALLLRLSLEAGLLKNAALAVLLIGGLSTLLVNGNPMLRFDGYHVMTDFLELPHWAQRSQALWRFLAKRWLLHVKNTAAFEGDAPGARLWLSAFAPLSWPYRVVLMAWLALLLASMHPMLGLAAVGLALWTLLLQPPAWKAARFVLNAPELQGQRAKAVGLSALGSVALGENSGGSIATDSTDTSGRTARATFSVGFAIGREQPCPCG